MTAGWTADSWERVAAYAAAEKVKTKTKAVSLRKNYLATTGECCLYSPGFHKPKVPTFTTTTGETRE